MVLDNDGSDGEVGSGISRRRALKTTGMIAVAGGFAGCTGGGGGGGGGSGDNNGGNNSTGGGGGGASGTVKWGFDPTQAQENAKEIKRLC